MSGFTLQKTALMQINMAGILLTAITVIKVGFQLALRRSGGIWFTTASRSPGTHVKDL
jgi:hypothetical protein